MPARAVVPRVPWGWPQASGSAHEPAAGRVLEKTNHAVGSFREDKGDKERSDPARPATC